MTVNTVSPAIISRAEFNLNAGQTKTPQLVRMDFTNLVTNGDFTTNTTGWTAVNATLSVVSGAMRVADNGVASAAYQAVTLVVGKTYTLTFDLIATSSGNAPYGIGTGVPNGSSTVVGGTEYTTSGNGQYTITFVATASTMYATFGSLSAESADYDNITIHEADPSDDAPWLRLPYGYSVGRTGMIVRDGVILHPSDYTEIKDSGQTWIKPIVAPGVSTEFSIWGSTA